MAVVVQIYTAQSVEEALALADVGVGHVGVTPARRGLPGEIDVHLAGKICRTLRGRARSVALSVEVDPDDIVGMVESVEADILHLCGPPGALGPSEVAHLSRRVPDVDIMQAIGVTGPEAIEAAQQFGPVVDFLLLDSVAPGIPGVGAAGTVHDWELSAEIVRAVDLPVILAGGLSPDNVAEAIERVRPWGVDSLTHTNRTRADGTFRKDLERVARFVEQAAVT